MYKPELLAPAGSFDALRAALNAGADAVYIGGSMFGARAYADNPDEDALLKCIDFCHLRDKKIYLTVNTILKNNELYDKLYSFLKPCYEEGLDAVIVQDRGVMRFINDNFKGLPIHISTQAGVTAAAGAELLASEFDAITRVVPARELSLKELARFREETKLEMEVFIHGALCYCYSGQCLLSSMIGGRSGNRGRCAQPCRKLYSAMVDNERREEKYYLSPKDICSVEQLESLIGLGIDSFKIEGRMKSPEYVANVVDGYRRLIDRHFSEEKSSFSNALITASFKEIYNRGGFNNGYFSQHNGPDMMSMERNGHSGVQVAKVTKVNSREAVIRLNKEIHAADVLEIRSGINSVYEFTVGAAQDGKQAGDIIKILTMKGKNAQPGMEVYRTKNASLLSSLNDNFLKINSRIKVHAEFECVFGKPVRLTFSSPDGSFSVSVEGNAPQKAQNAPATKESIIKQLSKLGDTDFEYADISVKLEDGLFISVSELNSIRREACAKYADEYPARLSRKNFEETYDSAVGKRFTENNCSSQSTSSATLTIVASVVNPGQFKAAAKAEKVSEIYYNISGFDTAELDEAVAQADLCKKKLYIGLPYICRRAMFDKVVELIKKYVHKASFIARNNEEISLLLKNNAAFRTDYNMYVMNDAAAEQLLAFAKGFTYSPEANRSELAELISAYPSGDLLVYGRMPVMISAQCAYYNTTGRCRKGTAYTGKITSEEMYRQAVVFTDEKGYSFKSVQFCDFCYNVIYNSAVTDITARTGELEGLKAERIRMDFTFEDPQKVTLLCNLQPVGQNHIPSDEKYTNGHFNRGIE